MYVITNYTFDPVVGSENDGVVYCLLPRGRRLVPVYKNLYINTRFQNKHDARKDVIYYDGGAFFFVVFFSFFYSPRDVHARPRLVNVPLRMPCGCRVLQSGGGVQHTRIIRII